MASSCGDRPTTTLDLLMHGAPIADFNSYVELVYTESTLSTKEITVFLLHVPRLNTSIRPSKAFVICMFGSRVRVTGFPGLQRRC